MPEVTLPEAAVELRVSTDTIRRRIKAGELTARADPRGRYLVEVPELASEASEEPSGAASAPTQPQGDLKLELAHTRELLAEVRRQRDQLEQQVQAQWQHLERADQERSELRILLGDAQQLARMIPGSAQQPAAQEEGTEKAPRPSRA